MGNGYRYSADYNNVHCQSHKRYLTLKNFEQIFNNCVFILNHKDIVVLPICTKNSRGTVVQNIFYVNK